MRAALGLGWRLGLRPHGQGRVRAGAMAVVAAVGTVLWLAAASSVSASAVSFQQPGVDNGIDIPSILLRGGVLLAVGVPVLVASAAAGRMSAATRARRLARLRLLGLSTGGLAVVGIGESLLWAGGGWIFGLMTEVTFSSTLAQTPGIARIGSGASSGPGIGALVLSALVPGAMLLGILSAGLPRTAPGSAAREVRSGPPGVWRAAPLLMGVCLLLLVPFARTRSVETLTICFLGGTALVLLGSALTLALMARAFALLLRGSGRPTAIIAGRRLEAQPASLSRVLAALVVAFAIATALQGLVAVIRTMPQVAAVEYDRTVEAKAQVYVPHGMDAAAFERQAREVGGVRAVAAARTAEVAVPEGSVPPSGIVDEGGGVPVIVASCADMRVLVPSFSGCSDHHPAWILSSVDPQTSLPPGPWELRATTDDGGPGQVVASIPTVQPAPSRRTVPRPGEDSEEEGALFVPVSMLTVDQASALPVTIGTVLASPRPDLLAQLEDRGIRPRAAWAVEDYVYWQQAVALIRTLSVIVLAVGLGSFLLGAVDRALERSAEVGRLRVMGTPVGVLRRAHALEILAPLLGGILLAVALGTWIAQIYLSMSSGRTIVLGWSTAVIPLAAAVPAAVVVTIATGIGLGGRIPAEALRTP